MTIQEECAVIMSNMVSITLAYLTQDGDEQKAKELWVGIGIEIDELNADTMTILNA